MTVQNYNYFHNWGRNKHYLTLERGGTGAGAVAPYTGTASARVGGVGGC